MGCILADDMGLGKTMQLLSYLVTVKARLKGDLSVLVICPASVVSVWLHENFLFTPELRMTPLSGSMEKRKNIFYDSAEWDVLVATYSVVRNDVHYMKKHRFNAVVLDEAQQIKNPNAEITRAVKSLISEHRIALTGTPLENRLMDLWSIVDFLNPGYLDTAESFSALYVDSPSQRAKLRKQISPIMLRRLKSEVASELPSRTEELIAIPLSDVQHQLYHEELVAARKDLKSKGTVEIFATLTRLRQICCHPDLVSKGNRKIQVPSEKNDSPVDSTLESSKLECLLERLTELGAEGHSVLVFSQFTRMLDLIEHELRRNQFNTFKITGKTSADDRTRYVRNFQATDVPSVFLLSLKAAGTGLTLTRADYVFIFDPWWNPAVERQAIDRTHRIGQTKSVIAYRLVAADTIEEKIVRMQEEKQMLFSQTVDEGKALPTRLKVEDLILLLSDA
jgi:SNF2 family DNA or RNA helicase